MVWHHLKKDENNMSYTQVKTVGMQEEQHGLASPEIG